MVFQSLVVDSNTERSTDSVLTAVAFTDRVFLVVLTVEIVFQQVHHFLRFFRQPVFLHQWHNSHLYRGQSCRQAQYDTGILFAVFAQVFFAISSRHNLQEHSVYTDRGFDHIRHIRFVQFGIEILNLFTGILLML